MKISPLAAVVCAAGLLSAPSAQAFGVNAGTETAVGGSVSATLSWDAGEFGPSNARLAIRRNGVLGFDALIPRVCGENCDRFGSDADDFQIRDLDGDAEPEAVLAMDSIQPCCVILGIYDYRPADGTYREFASVFKNFLTIEDFDRDGGAEIKTSDTRFPGEVEPITIFKYSRANRGALTNVTRDFPKQIRADASNARAYFEVRKPNKLRARAALRSYIADQYLLGRGETGLRTLDKQAKRGVLGTRREVQRYRKRLLALLDRLGYR